MATPTRRRRAAPVKRVAFSKIAASEEDPRVIRARLAVERFRRMVPGLTGFAKMITRNDEVRVVISAGSAHTDGKNIYLRPPIELGDKIDHLRDFCDKRDTYGPLCLACKRQEEIMMGLYHEIAHIAYDSFAGATDEDKRELLIRALREAGDPDDESTRAGKINSRVKNGVADLEKSDVGVSYIGMAGLISPYLPMLVNAMEDWRVNASLQAARPGTREAFAARYRKVMECGITEMDGNTWYWGEREPDSQFIIGVLLRLCGYEYHMLTPEVIEAIDSPEMDAALAKASYVRSVRDVYQMAFPVLEVGRGYGFLCSPDDPEDDHPAEPDDEDTGGDDDTTGPTKDDDETEAKAKPDDAASGSDGDGSPDDTDEDADTDDEDGNVESSADGDDEDGGSTEQEGDTDDPADDGSEGSSDGEPDDEDADAPDSSGGNEGTGEAGDADSDDASPSDDGDGSGEADPDGDDDDTEGDGDGEGGDGRNPSDPDQVKADLDRFLGHDNPSHFPSDNDLSKGSDGDNSDPDPEADSIEVDRAVVQGEHWDRPSNGLYGVKIIREGDDYPGAYSSYHAWKRYEGYPNPVEAASVGMTEATEGILGPSLMRMRLAFAANKKRKNEINLKAGKVNGRTLGKRAAVGDPRLFKKPHLPGKRDYFVVIGLDISGSTSGQRIQLMKSAALAQAELCHRAGVDFAFYAHTGAPGLESSGAFTFDLDIYCVKEPNEPWTDVQRDRLRLIYSSAANLDGHTLEFYRKRCDESQATDKIIMYYTDGAMPAENFNEELAVLEAELKTIERKGYVMLAVGVENSEPEQYGIDTVRLDTIEDVPAVVKHMEKRLSGM